MNIDINKTIQDKANKIVNEAITKTPEASKIAGFDEFLKELVGLSIRQGFIYGARTSEQMCGSLLEMVKDKGN